MDSFSPYQFNLLQKLELNFAKNKPRFSICRTEAGRPDERKLVKVPIFLKPAMRERTK